MTYRRTTVFVASSLYFSFANQYSLGGGFPFPIVLVPRYKLSLCHSPIKPNLLGFLGIGVFACGLRDHEVRIKYVFPFLIYIIFFDLHVQRTPYNQGLPLNRICNLLITTIHQRWHLFTFRFVTFIFNLTIVSCKHNSSVWTMRCNVPLP